jgi:predicted amidohydrolase
MPLARFATHAKGEQIHVAAWPDVPEMHHVASRHYAFEGRCYVVCAASYLRVEDVPDDFELKALLSTGGEYGGSVEELLPGGSGIIGPDGEWLAGPVAGREEIVYADADLSVIAGEQQAFDAAGHYNRPDIFRLTVDERPREPVSWMRAAQPAP